MGMIERTNVPASDMPQASGPAPSSKRSLIVVVIAIVIVISLAAIAYSVLTAINAASNSHEGEMPVIDFAMTDADGNVVQLSSLQGKPMVLNFWASTCGPCKSEMPGFQAAYERFGDEVEFVMVNVPGFNGETKARALSLIEQRGYDFPVYFDTLDEGSTAYELTSIPRTFFITSDGYIMLYAMGSLDEETLFESIEQILD